MNWNKEIEKTMNHTYMILSKESFFENNEIEEQNRDYKLPMLLQNNIPGLLKVSKQALNGDNKLYYDISTLDSLENIYMKNEMDYKSVRELLIGCVNIYAMLEEYLLEGEQLILSPEYIFVDTETDKPMFTFYPEYGKDPREAFISLVEFILEHLDHTDEDTVMLGYKIYKITRNANFTMKQVETAILENPKDKNKIRPEKYEQKYDYLESEEDLGTSLLIPDNDDKATEKTNLKDVVKEKVEVSKELFAMVGCGIALVVLAFVMVYFMNSDTNVLSGKGMLYMVGLFVMTFVSLIIVAVAYMKKKMVIK